MLCAAHSFGQGVITTVAGSTWVFRGDGGAAVSAPLGAVTGVAADSAGNIYATDLGNHIVVRIAPSGTLNVLAGNGIQWFSGDGGPGANASVNNPSGIAVDPSGNVYFADQENHRVRRITPAGIISTVAGIGASEGPVGDGGPATSAMLIFPWGAALDSSGNLYISEKHGHRVRKVTPAGVITTIAGSGVRGFSGDGGPAASARLEEPRGIAVDRAGNIYVADSVNQRIRRVDTAGTITTFAGNGLARSEGDGGPAAQASLHFPLGVAVDSAGAVYITDAYSFRIRQVSGGIIRTIAGTGTEGFAGDPGPAATAAFRDIAGVTVDGSGAIYVADTGNQRVRRVAGGTVTTVAGNGTYKYSGDGAAATSASLHTPRGVAVDAVGNLYIADLFNHRVRRVSPAGIITTFAGTGVQGFSGDGGPATSAMLNEPRGVAVDAAGNVYIADGFNARVRRVAPNGTITTFAGSTRGSAAGDGGPATSAIMGAAWDVAVDSAGNVYIADRQNHRIRKVDTRGVITTFAGGGSSLAEGVPATQAALNSPDGVGVDSASNVYIADSLNNRVRRVNSMGIIETVAGTGTFGFAGDGGAATRAQLTEPLDVAVDSAGNLYIADQWNGRVRRVAGGLITTFAGGGSGEQFAGDGGAATGAAMSRPASLAFDSAGNLYIADQDNDRVRKVLVVAPSFAVVPESLSFTVPAGATSVAPQTVAVTGPVTGVGWTAQATTDSGAWLTVSPAAGAVPGVITASVNAGTLAPGTYRGRISVQAPLATPPVRVVNVEFTITAAAPAELRVDPAAISFEARTASGNPRPAALTISNAGSGSLAWTARAETASGGNWLQLSAASGTTTANASSVLQVSAAVTNLAAGVYSGTVRVESVQPAQARVVPVTLVLSEVAQTIVLSRTGLLLTGVEGGTAIPSETVGILNGGQGSMSWTAQATTTAGGNWLRVTPSSGRSDAASTDVPVIEVSAGAQGLRAGTYSGLIRIDAPGAANSPQFVTVDLNLLPAGANPGVQVRPSALIFATEQGGASPSSQGVRLATPSAAAVEVRAGVLTDTGNWLQVLPRNLVVSAADPRTITIQPVAGQLTPGVYRGAVTLLFLDGTPAQVINVLFVVTARPAASAVAFSAGEGAATHCAPQRLLAAPRTLAANFSSPAGWPATIEVQVADDCGHAITDATVVATFSTADAALRLTSLRNGIYTGTWRPVTVSPAVTATVRADAPGLAPAVLQFQGQVSATQGVPTLFPGGLVNGASYAPGGAVAPGSIVSVFGRNLARSRTVATTTPLSTSLGGAALLIGGREAPLFFTSDGQINAQIPFELSPNSRPQAVVRTRRESGADAFGVPEGITLAAAQPACFTMNQQGTGQGAILNTRAQVVDASAPAAAGEVVAVYCTGLGATNPTVASGQAAPSAEPLARVTAAVAARVGGRTATVHFAGLAPGFVGLYQVNIEIPSGIEPGSTVPLVILQNGVPSNTVTLALR